MAGAALALAPAGAALAATASGSQYGPPPPVTTPAPGGFTTVVTTVTIGPAGGTIGPVAVDADVTVKVPAGAFATPMQVTLTAPVLSEIPAHAGTTVVAGAGITVSQNGTKYQGTFLKPVTVTFTAPNITAASDVVVWNGSSFVTDPDATATAGAVTVSFDSDPDFAVEAPLSPKAAPVPSATVPVTGKPFVGEGILAGVLILGGAGGIAVSRRRVRASRARD